MTMISYAQNFEDVLLERAFKDISEGFYVDVGAWRPDADSVTNHFYQRGWRGINIEPNPQCFPFFEAARVRDINLPVGISNQRGSAKLFVPQSSSGLGTFLRAQSGEVDGELISVEIELRTLTDVLGEHAGSVIHFLKIDVEGMEREVIEGCNWTQFRPQIVVVEATVPNSPILNHHVWEPLLLSANYDFVWFDGLNRFYVAQECRDLKKHFLVPPNVFDDFVLSKIPELESVVSSLDEEVHRQHAELVRRHEEIAFLNQVIVERNEHLAKLVHQVAALQQSIVVRVAQKLISRLRRR